MPVKQPPKKMVAAALLAARHHLALVCDPRARAGDEARMLSRLQAHADKIVKAYNTRNPGLGATREAVLLDLDTEARRLGALVPVLGRDM